MVGLFGKNRIIEQVVTLQKNLSGSFEKIREEFDDHLDAINENTNELQMQYEYMTHLEMKIDKLSERMEELHMIILQATQSSFLTRQEQKIFLTLYTFGEESPLTHADIAGRVNMNEMTVRNALVCLLKKGIPIVEEKIDDKQFFRLTREFKEQQAKEHIIKVDEDLAAEVF